jgi:hypothetical protein
MDKLTTQPGTNNKGESRKADNNLLRFHGDAGASAVEDAAIGYQSPSIIAAGANAQTVSILATLVNLSLSLICVKAPALIEKIGLTKRGAMTLAFTNMITWIPLVLIFLFSDLGITPVWIAILWLANIMPAMLVSFQKDNWLSNIVPDRTLGKYLGQRLAIKSGVYLAAFFTLGYMMDRLGEKNLTSFGFVFLLAVVMTFVDFMIFTFMHDPKKEALAQKVVISKEKFGLFDFLGDLKQKKLDKFILFTSFINVSIGISAPFYAVYMLQEQNFSYMSYTIIISVEFLARVISGPFWGKFADKAGNIKVLTIVSRIVPALPICWLFSTNIGYLAVIQILSGICWGAFDLSTQSYLYKVAPQPRKLRYIVYTRSLMLFSVAMGGIAGSFLVQNVFSIFGSKLLSVFMISGFLRAVIVMFLIPKLIDLAVSYGIPQRSKISLALTKKATAKHGLFYHVPTEETAEVPSNVIDGSKMHKRNPAMEQRLMEAQAAKNQLNLLTEAVQSGHKRNWALEALVKAQASKVEQKVPAKAAGEKPQEIDLTNAIRRNWVIKGIIDKPVTEPDQPAEMKPTRRPWFGDAEISANYRTRVPVLAAVGNNGNMNVNLEKSGNRDGLFYNDTGWARYKEESLQAVLKEKQAGKAALKTKQIFIESSYPWRNTY